MEGWGAWHVFWEEDLWQHIETLSNEMKCVTLLIFGGGNPVCVVPGRGSSIGWDREQQGRF